VDLDQYGFDHVGLIAGERIESALNLNSDGDRGSTRNSAVMLLTDKRLIHLRRDGKQRRADFALIEDVEAVAVAAESLGNGAFWWAALGFIVAAILYFVIDSQLYRIAGSAIVALMGAWLIADRITDAGRSVVVVKTGTSQLRFNLNSADASADTYSFINLLFQLKADGSVESRSDPSSFAPR